MIKIKVVTTNNFAESSDEEIVAACRDILARTSTPDKLRPYARKLLRTKKPDATVAGTILWAHLCGWPRKWEVRS